MADPGLLSIDLFWLERHGRAYPLDDGRLALEVPEPLPECNDIIWECEYHRCADGETLMDIAARYYQGSGLVSWPVGLWEVLAGCQRPPIDNPFKRLPMGLLLIIPPPDYIREIALGDSLRDDPLL